MALIKCYECGKEISDKAPSCPQCGAPQVVAAKKEVKVKKSINFKKYLKPVPIGLGLIFIPLIGTAATPLIQANGNIKAVAWRYKNTDFIKSRCAFYHLEKTSLPKNCRSLLYKLGEKAEKVSFYSHSACMSEKKFKSPQVYNTCVEKWDKEYEERQRIKTPVLGSLDQTTYKGKTYTASRRCPVGQNMYWSINSGFMRKSKILELGCMTASENEAYWREYELRKSGAPRVTGGGSGSNFSQQQQIHNNTMNNIRNQFNQQQLQYQQNYQPSTLGGGGLTTPDGGYYYSD